MEGSATVDITECPSDADDNTVGTNTGVTSQTSSITGQRRCHLASDFEQLPNKTECNAATGVSTGRAASARVVPAHVDLRQGSTSVDARGHSASRSLPRPHSCGSDSGYSGSSGSYPEHLSATLLGSSVSLGAELRVDASKHGTAEDGIGKGHVINNDIIHDIGIKDGIVLENEPIIDDGFCRRRVIGDGIVSDSVNNPSVHTRNVGVKNSTATTRVPGCNVVNTVSHGMINNDQGTMLQILINGPSGVELDTSSKVTSEVAASPVGETPPECIMGHGTSTDNTDYPLVVTSCTSPNNHLQSEAAIVLPERFRPRQKRQQEEYACGGDGDERPSAKKPETPSNAVGGDKHGTGKKCRPCSCDDVVSADVGTDARSESGPGRLCACASSQQNTDDEKDRSKDMRLAIQWLHEQMVQMKAQDKVLMRQFLELRASIHGLRTDNITPSSTSDLSATSRSVTALQSATPGMPRLRGDDCEVEFRARTVSMVPARPRSKLQEFL